MQDGLAPLFSVQRIGCLDASVTNDAGAITVHDAIRGTKATIGHATQTREVARFTLRLIEKVDPAPEMTGIVISQAGTSEVIILLYCDCDCDSTGVGRDAAMKYMAHATDSHLARDFVPGSCFFGDTRVAASRPHSEHN